VKLLPWCLQNVMLACSVRERIQTIMRRAESSRAARLPLERLVSRSGQQALLIELIRDDWDETASCEISAR
jgi:hypothetical protein